MWYRPLLCVMVVQEVVELELLSMSGSSSDNDGYYRVIARIGATAGACLSVQREGRG